MSMSAHLAHHLPVFTQIMVEGILDESGCAVFGGSWDAPAWLPDGVFTVPVERSYEIYRIDVQPIKYATEQSFGFRLGVQPLDVLLLPVVGERIVSLEMRPTVLLPTTTRAQLLVRGLPGDRVAAWVTLFASVRQ